MEEFEKPAHLELSGSLEENWIKFKRAFEWYLEAKDLGKASDARKIAILLTVAGSEARELFSTFTFDEGEEKKYAAVLGKFEEHCKEAKNETVERYKLRCTVQQEGQLFEQFLTELRKKSKSCGFGDLTDSMIRDQIVVGIKDEKVREKLLKTEKLDLKKTIAVCKASELVKTQTKQMAQDEGMVNVVRNEWKSGRGAKSSSPASLTSASKKGQARNVIKDCGYCGGTHLRMKCPAYGKTCARCGRLNHYAQQCRAREGDGAKAGHIRVVEEATDSDDEIFVGYVEEQTTPNSSDPWKEALKINETLITFLIDTGSRVNMLSYKDYGRLRQKPEIRSTRLRFKAYNNNPIPVIGACTVKVLRKGREYDLDMIVAKEGISIIGAEDSEKVGLVARVYQTITNVKEQVAAKYPELFTGVGCLPVKHKIQLEENATPVIRPARRCPAHIKDELKKELERLEEQGIITKVQEPTDWVNQMVWERKKSGSLRICIDPRDLNKAVKREHYQLPTREEIETEMTGAKYFSKLDAANGFFQIELEEESAKLCTFSTPFGRFYFNRLPMGLTSSPEVFHRTVSQIIEGLEGARNFIDDIIVWGTTLQEHNSRLESVLQRLRGANMRLNLDKCVFQQTEITYLGELLSASGIQPSPEKVKAVKEMPRPEDKEGLRRALGLVNYLGKFIPNVSDATKDLRSLARDGAEFNWTMEAEREWNKVTNYLTTAPILKFYDPLRETKVSTDASKTGLGAVLLQKYDDEWLPVMYASRALTPTEVRYAQIEKETLGMLFGLTRFHDYVYGQRVIAETDHKPLLGIATKDFDSMSPRIQRMMMRMQRYDLKWEYMPGTKLVLADALSRSYLPTSKRGDLEEEIEIHVRMVVQSRLSEVKMKEVAEATAADEVLSKVVRDLLDGKSTTVKPYQDFAEELSVVDGFLMRDTRVVIPVSMRSETLEIIHEGHLGVEKCKRRARKAVYWPGMNEAIKQKVSRCATCQIHQYQRKREPLLSTSEAAAEIPWGMVAADLFSLKGRNYLLMKDYCSNFPETCLLTSTTSAAVILQMKSIFARHGIPLVVRTDNGPQFASSEFVEFARKYGFKHQTSSPTYPKSNGMAENGVKTVKSLLKKAIDAKEDPYLALLNYRTAPLECGKSPTDILYNGRDVNTRLTSFFKAESSLCDKTAKPAQNKPPAQVTYSKTLQQQKQSKYYNRGTVTYPPLQSGEVVRIRKGGMWPVKAKVMEEVAPRSYKVKTEQGVLYRRNLQQLLPTGETACQESDSLEGDDVGQEGEQEGTDVQEPQVRRSGRIRNEPVWMKDFVKH